MTKMNEPDFPDLVPDRWCISFSNGVLLLPSQPGPDCYERFVPYPSSGAPMPAELVGRTARHHVNLPFPTAPETPLLTKVLDEQDMSPAVQEVLMVLTGRLLFPVGTLDNWQVAPFLHGIAGTGKDQGNKQLFWP